MSDEPVLSPEEVAGVLADPTEGGQASPTPREGPLPYSLREPVAIPPSAEKHATQAMRKLVAAFAGVLPAGPETEVQLELDGLQQQRPESALSTLPSPAWVFSITRAGGGGVALALHPAVGLALVDLILGGSGELPESGREPTPLEARVLIRLVESAAEKLTDVLGALADEPVSFSAGSLAPALAVRGETVGVGLLRIGLGEANHSSLLLASASLLLPERRVAKAKIRPPGPLSVPLDRIELEIRPVLLAGRICLNDVLALEPGKVLCLDAPEHAGLELRVGGRKIADGRILREPDRVVFAVERKIGRQRKEDHE